jgi:uncharacterized protein (DUF2062 family)
MKRLSRKSITYYYLKLVNHAGSPDYIGRGVAVGLFIAFFIPFGVQMVVAYALAAVVRAARIPAVALTWIANNFTVPVIYPVQCYIGSYIICHPLHYEYVKNTFLKVIREMSYKALFDLGVDLTIAFFAGGMLFGLVSGISGYFAAIWLVKRYRRKKQIRKSGKIRNTGQSNCG